MIRASDKLIKQEKPDFCLVVIQAYGHTIPVWTRLKTAAADHHTRGSFQNCCHNVRAVKDVRVTFTLFGRCSYPE